MSFSRFRSRRSLAIALTLVALAIAGAVMSRTTGDAPEATYSALTTAIEAGRVDSMLVIPGYEVSGVWRSPRADSAATPFAVSYSAYSVDVLLERAEAKGVIIAFAPAPKPGAAGEIVALLLNVALIGGLFYLIKQQTGSQGGEAGEQVTSQLTFDHVAGNTEAITELREIVELLKNPGEFAALGARPIKGALLYGPPGTGKTLLARAVAGEAGVAFYTLSGAQVTGFIVGMGVWRVRSLLKKARKTGGVIFIDEMDALGGRRGRTSSHNEDDRTLNQLLVELDGFSPTDNVVVIGATNRPEDLDPALLRPGRLDRQIAVGLPTVDERTDILALHARLRRMPLAADVDLRRLARLLPGASGAELANILNEAALIAARHGAAQIAWAHFEGARDRILLGKERPGFRASEAEWKTVAYHEAGHALCGVLACPTVALHKVTIQPRGRAMGVAHFSPADDEHLHSYTALKGQLVMSLGGRAAEQAMFGRDAITSGAESDLQHANQIARQMVYRLGMGEHTGFLTHPGEPGALSPTMHAMMDQDVQQLLSDSYARALAYVKAYRSALEALAAALLDRETIDGAEAVAIMRAAGLPATPVAA